MESLLNLINRLNQAPELYEKLKAKQQAVLQDLFFDKPLLSLENYLREKEYRTLLRYTWWHKLSGPPLFPASQVAMVGNSKRQSATLPQKRRLTIGKNPASARHEIENKTLSLFSD